MAIPAALLRRVADPAPDADLLARFAAGRDADAFAELVRRHGPVVYRVCRRLAGPDAEVRPALVNMVEAAREMRTRA